MENAEISTYIQGGVRLPICAAASVKLHVVKPWTGFGAEGASITYASAVRCTWFCSKVDGVVPENQHVNLSKCASSLLWDLDLWQAEFRLRGVGFGV